MDRDKLVEVLATLLLIRSRSMDEELDREGAVPKAVKLLGKIINSEGVRVKVEDVALG